MEDQVSTAYVTYSPKLVRIAERITKDLHAAEDVAHEAFIGLLKTLHNGQAIDNLEAWLVAVTKRNALNWVDSRRRRMKREVTPTSLLAQERDGTPDESAAWELIPGGQAAEAEALTRMEATTLRLTIHSAVGEQRATMFLLAVYGYSHRTIACHMDMTEKAVESSLVRIRQVVQKAMGLRHDKERTPNQTNRLSAWYEEAQTLRRAGWSIEALMEWFGKSRRSIHNALSARESA